MINNAINPTQAIAVINGMGHIITFNEKVADFVYRAAELGATMVDIAGVLGIRLDQLFSGYIQQWQRGHGMSNINVLAALYANALSGDVRAQIFWAKAQAGLNEVDVTIQANFLDRTSGSPLDYRDMSIEELKQEINHVEQLQKGHVKAEEAILIEETTNVN